MGMLIFRPLTRIGYNAARPVRNSLNILYYLHNFHYFISLFMGIDLEVLPCVHPD